MYKIIKKLGKIVTAYRLGSDTPELQDLIQRGKLTARDDGRWAVLSREAAKGGGGGEIAQNGDYVKLDDRHCPYPVAKDWFEANHRKVGPDLYEQIPKPLDAWDAGQPPCAEIDFLCREKGLVLNDADPAHYYTAPLWGTTECADRDAVLVFYSITRAADGTVTDADYNLVARDAFEKSYIVLTGPVKEDPKGLYDRGLALLNGASWGADPAQAAALITRAAEAGLPQAIEKLVSMYKTGNGAVRCSDTALEWQRRLTAYWQKRFEAEPNDITLLARLSSLASLGNMLFEQHRLPEAAAVCSTLLDACNTAPAQDSPRMRARYLSIGCSKLGDISLAAGDTPVARAWYDRGFAAAEPLLQRQDRADTRDILAAYNCRFAVCAPTPEEKTKDLEQAEAIWAALHEQYPEAAQYTEKLALVRQMLAAS